MEIVQRVHWLRARALNNRWKEELTLVGYEMEWTTRYFLYRAGKWQVQCPEAGPSAYAARQAAQWGGLASEADRAFGVVNREYIKVM
jgi:hypothetical protein